MAIHLRGKKHTTAAALFQKMGKLPTKKKAAITFNNFKIDSTKKVERRNRFATEYVEKVTLGGLETDTSHKRIKVTCYFCNHTFLNHVSMSQLF